MKNSHLIEYGKECELLERVDGKYKVRIYGKDEIVEKLVDYTPIINEYKYDGVLVERDGEYSRIEKYTTYFRESGLVYAYKKHDVNRYSDSMIYESEIGKDYKIVENNPFLQKEQVFELLDESSKEKQPLKDRIKELSKEIEDAKLKIENIDKKYDIESKCEHIWEENGEEEYNDGRSTRKIYICSICGKEDSQYWHKIF